MLRLTKIINIIHKYNPNTNIKLIKKAYYYSEKAHTGQIRMNGEPYFNHPVEVAIILIKLKLDDASICTGFLHDTIEDTYTSKEDIKRLFGKDIALLVDGLTKLSKVHFHSKEEKQAENFRKMLVAISRDIRVLLVKLADRLHNMRTLQFMNIEKQEQIASETMEFYVPLANRLGIGWLKIELEDLSFKHLNVVEYNYLKEKVGQTKHERVNFIDSISNRLSKILIDNGMKKIIVFGRYKHLWSIYRKMCNKDLIFEEIHDIIAFRILVNSVQQCYEALGYIHLLWKPIPGRFKDYIALPKVNGYRSLHTTLFTYNRYGIEIQIRSKEMDEIAESGIAAHWKYKENGINTKIKNISFRGFLWLHRLMNWQKTLKDPNEFLDSIKVDLFIEGTYVFTPNSDVIELPQGSTPVDFAFAIHSDLGIKCFQAKVNNYMVSLKYILKNGDTCLIITRSEQFPSKNWLKFVKTSRAKIKIRSFLRAEDRKQSKEIGKRLLIKELSRYSIEFKKFIKSDNMSKILHTYKYKTIDYLFISLGYGKIDISTLLQSLLPLKLKRKYNLAIQNSKSLKIVKCFSKDSKSVIKLDGVENMLVDYASCCVPIKGDSIIGYIYRDKKMIIHRRNCIKVMQIARERRINVLWDFDTIFISTVFIRVYTNDREGMLKDLSSVFSRLSINIVEAKCKVLTNVRTVSVFKCKIHDLDQLINLIKKLLLVNGVYSANRITLVEFFNNS